MTTHDQRISGLVPHVLELAEGLDWPAIEIPPDTAVGPGRDAWTGWSAQADRSQLATAIGVLVVRVHQPVA